MYSTGGGTLELQETSLWWRDMDTGRRNKCKCSANAHLLDLVPLQGLNRHLHNVNIRNLQQKGHVWAKDRLQMCVRTARR